MALHNEHWCDRCPSRAYAHVTLYSTLELFFCAHHFKQHKEQLEAEAMMVDDETDLLKVHVTDDKHVV